MATDPAVRDHQAWLSYLQPDGLVVSASALVDAQVVLNKNVLPLQEQFLPFVEELPQDDDPILAITDFSKFVLEFLGWPDDCLVGLAPDKPVPDTLTVPLAEYGETLAPTFAFHDPKPKDPAYPWLLVVQIHPPETDLDAAITRQEAGWSASRSRRFERLLREIQVPIGLLTNGTHIRLMYAPRGENAGSLTFPIRAMTEVAGRPILAAFHLLLDSYRLLAAPSEARLPALLAKSREYQSAVSSALAQQVMDALYELLRGLQAANDRTQGELLRDILKRDPDEVYNGLLTVLMRLVFLLFAEDRGLLPTSTLYVRHYAVHGLFERLRSDAEQYPDTMDSRYGAWAQLLALFRCIYKGCTHPEMKMPARSGYLFDADRFPFLDGRTCAEPRLPLIGDGTIYRTLEKLLLLDGERLSYRTLDVEEIGSVYQTVMGFRLEVADGPSIAITGKRKHKGEVPAASVINLANLLRIPGVGRAKWLRDNSDQEVTGEAEKALKAAETLDGLLVALEKKIARGATPHLVPQGSMVLQPTDERRRSGSHYTPRSLTEPIVRTTLRPILERLGPTPIPEQILNLKVCDIGMGSGAFLVETCRQLGDELVKAWHAHRTVPVIPADEDEVLHARRLVAQSCLYGVDRNPMAVDLAKLSLWLATLAKDHPFTFLDHALRPGDSLVGLTRAQIAGFHWQPNAERVFGQDRLEKKIEQVSAYRREILEGGDLVLPALKRQKLDLADDALKEVREAGDLVVAAFFGRDKDKKRMELRASYLDWLTEVYLGNIAKALELQKVTSELRGGQFPISPFHWEVEFPEVFDRENPGFDGIVGNPPFMGGGKISGTAGPSYLEWIKTLHTESHGNADIVAHFFRRAFNMLRNEGCFGLIATNTIGQGDTRATGLRWICTHGGTICAALKRYKWPGQAAVVVSIVHVAKGSPVGSPELDNRRVPVITAYLFHSGGHENPSVLPANVDKAFNGVKIYGQGFSFDDTDTKGVANPVTEMRQLLTKNPKNGERIFPYIGGEEINDSPTHAHHRFVINFAGWPLRRDNFGKKWVDASEEERKAWLRGGVVPSDYPSPVAMDWPDLLHIVEKKVKPERMELREDADGGRLRLFWWLFGRARPELYSAIARLKRVMVNSQVSQYPAFAFLPSNWVYSHAVNIFALETDGAFAALQSRIHEVWVRFLASSMKDDLRYTPTDCFETFPFPVGFETDPALEAAGREYYEFRAALMVRNNEGLTKTYNRFHNPDERLSDILHLRELHAHMDAAVLTAYGWTDIQPTCEFLLDYEEDEGDGKNKRKKPWRYRWPDEIRDEVLARLLALNAQRAEEERLAAKAEEAGAGAKSKGKKTTTKKSTKAHDQDNLL